MKIRLFLVSVAWFLAGFVSTQAQNAPCTCEDARDLFNRLNEAYAAIAEYQNQIDGMLAKEKVIGGPFMYEDSTYRKMQDRIQAAINHVTDTEAKKAPAETFGDCNTDLSRAQTMCLKQVVDVHEDVHRRSCKEKKQLYDWTQGTHTWKQNMRMADVAKEEISAYTAEINYINIILRNLPRLCHPQAWFGIIKTRRTGSDKEGSKTIKVIEKGDWILLIKQDGTAFPMPVGLPPAAEAAMRQSMAKAQAALAKSGIGMSVTSTYANIERTSTWKGGGTECCSTDAGVEPNINMTEKVAGEAREKGNANVAFTAGKLIITFSHPPINGLKLESTDVVSSACPYDKSDAGVEADTTLSLTVPKLETSATSKILGGLEFLEGSKSEKMGGYTMVYEWNLKRIVGP